jgi:uncharacterized membrane protein YkoI
VYEVEIAGKDGRLREVTVDACLGSPFSAIVLNA